MTTGHIYKNNWGQNCKVLMFDKRETFYQAVDERNELIHTKSKTQIYTRTVTDFFERTSTLILDSNLTQQEEIIHRPGLPLRLNCFNEVFWAAEKFKTPNGFEKSLDQLGVDCEKFENLYTDKVVIFPVGQQSSHKRPVLLENTTGIFDGKELMFNCFNMQQEYVNPRKPYFSRFRLVPEGREEKRLTGFGLYRTGIKGNIPSFYLGGRMSLLELEMDDSLVV